MSSILFNLYIRISGDTDITLRFSDDLVDCAEYKKIYKIPLAVDRILKEKYEFNRTKRKQKLWLLYIKIIPVLLNIYVEQIKQVHYTYPGSNIINNGKNKTNIISVG